MWKYEITTNSNGIIISTNSYPNDRPHWSIGWSINELKKYYYRDENQETEIDKITHVYIKELK